MFVCSVNGLSAWRCAIINGMGHNKPEITSEHINQIKTLMYENPGWNRTVLSKKLCELWDWKSLAGQIKDISCWDLLRSLDRKGLISLGTV